MPKKSPKDLTFFRISCLDFREKPGRNGNKCPEFRIQCLFHPQKALFSGLNQAQIKLSICFYFCCLKNRTTKNISLSPSFSSACQLFRVISNHFVKPKV